MRVQHRHIIYVQGYDPRGLAQYYRMFRTELRKFGRLYQLSATLGRPQSTSDSEIASWTIETKADGWQTRTSYDFLRFEDFIQRDLAAPIWQTVFEAVWIYWRLVFGGTIARFWRANWRFATFITYPHLILLLEAVCAASLAFVFGKGLDALGIPIFFSAPAAAAVFFALLWTALKYTENQTYLLYLLCDTIWTWQKLDPALGRHGPRVVLLTIGGNFPIVGFHAASTGFRDHLRLLAVEPAIDWIDCQSRKDVMNFFQFDPIAAHGIDAGPLRRNPTIVPVRFREIIMPEHYGLFRWQFFRVHFQFVMANERPHAYDFFMIVCGPIPLRERMADPETALAIATAPDAAARELAWKRVESATQVGENDTGMVGREPSARRSG